MPTIGGGDDFVWIGGPDEGLWLLVVVGDEAIDGGLEIDDAFEDAALEAPLGEDGEETLDGVEPTGRGGREMGAPARMTPQPFDHLGVLASGARRQGHGNPNKDSYVGINPLALRRALPGHLR